MPKSAAAQVVCWGESSNHLWTCHTNVPGLMAVDSQLARLWYDGGNQWKAVIDTTGESFSDANFVKVKRWVENQVHGKEIDAWE
ncbi:MAG: hypothetical protein ACYDHY_06865 [Acidiferrobacterales bacterium]